MKFSTREILGIMLIFMVGVLALLSWQSFFAVMMTLGLADFWQPIMWFVLLSVFCFLGAAVWTKKIFLILGAGAIFLPGLFFLRVWEFSAVAGISSLLVFISLLQMQYEFTERVHFHFLKSIRMGSFLFVVSLALVVSSGYYVFLKQAAWEELVPRFRIGDEMTGIIFKVAGVVNPSFATLTEGDATVDEFLLNLERSQQLETDGTLVKDIMDVQYDTSGMSAEELQSVNAFKQDRMKDGNLAMQSMFLQSGREQIARLAGRTVKGDEKIFSVLSLALQNKLIALLNGEKAAKHMPSEAVPFFLSLLLFFTLLPFLSLLSFVCIFVAQLVFMIALRMKWLTLETRSVEQEKLAE